MMIELDEKEVRQKRGGAVEIQVLRCDIIRRHSLSEDGL
jgi:hypothetical protein